MNVGGDVPAGYKRTELGVIPKGWVVHPLREICWFQEGPGVRDTQFTASGVKLLNGTNIANGKLNLANTARFISVKEANGPYAHFLADTGDIVLASSGISIDRLAEKVAYVGECDRPLCMNTSTIRFKPEPNLLDRGFLFHTLTSSGFSAQIGEQATGSAQLNFGPSHVAKVSVALPPIGEQRAIADALGDVDALLDALGRQIAKQRDLKQAAMQQLLTGRTRLPGFTGEWQCVPFGDIAQIRNTKVVPASAPAGTQCVELDNLSHTTGRLLGTTAAAGTTAKYTFQAGDVLFGRLRTYLRKYWLATFDGLCSTEIWPLVPRDSRLHNTFLHLIVQTDQFVDAAGVSYGTHMPRSDWTVLRNFEVQLPPPAEQTAIAAVLSDMDTEITALEARRAKTRDLKQAMLQELLTGRTRLI